MYNNAPKLDKVLYHISIIWTALLIVFIFWTALDNHYWWMALWLIIFAISCPIFYKCVKYWDSQKYIKEIHPIMDSVWISVVPSVVSLVRSVLPPRFNYLKVPISCLLIALIVLSSMVNYYDKHKTNNRIRRIENHENIQSFHDNDLPYHHFPKHYNKKQINSAIEMRIHQLLVNNDLDNSHTNQDVNPKIDCLARKFINYRLKMMEMKGHS